jgi:hypothetical protein
METVMFRSANCVRTFIGAVIVSVLAHGTLQAADVPTEVLDSYLKVQTALAADELATATLESKALAVAAVKAGGDSAKLGPPAEKLGAAKSLEAARAAFGDLSDAIIKLAGGKSPGGDVHVAYCPMVKKSWLQKGETISNPYYGKSMLTCGEIKR